MTIRKALFPLLLLVALASAQISAANVLLALLALAWLRERRRDGRISDPSSKPIVQLVGLFVLLVSLSILFSREPATSLKALPGLLVFLLLPIAIDLVESTRQARAIFLALGSSGIFLSLVGFWQFAHRGPDLYNRIGGTLSHYMTFSGLTMIAGCLLLGFALEEKGGRRWIGALAALPFAAMVLSFTRNAYVGTIAALTAYLALRRPRGLLLLAAAVLLVFLLVPPEIQERMVSIGDLSDRTNRDRIAMARAGLRMIQDRPLFGVGPELVKPSYTLYRDADAPRWRVGHLHNNFLQIAAASGLFAAAAYLALLLLFFARTVRLLRHERAPQRSSLLAGSFLAGAAVTVAGLFEYNFGDTEVLMASLLFAAVPFSGSFSSRCDAAVNSS